MSKSKKSISNKGKRNSKKRLNNKRIVPISKITEIKPDDIYGPYFERLKKSMGYNYEKSGTCVHCEGEYKDWGNNPEPAYKFVEGRVCGTCNTKVVIRKRIENITNGLDLFHPLKETSRWDCIKRVKQSPNNTIGLWNKDWDPVTGSNPYFIICLYVYEIVNIKYSKSLVYEIRLVKE